MDSFAERLLYSVPNLVPEHSLRPLQVRICLSVYVNEYPVTYDYCYNRRVKKSKYSFLPSAFLLPKQHCFFKRAAYRSMNECGALVKGY